jgi:hypothetical protein
MPVKGREIGGRIASIAEQEVIAKILESMGLSREAPFQGPVRSLPQGMLDFDQ